MSLVLTCAPAGRPPGWGQTDETDDTVADASDLESQLRIEYARRLIQYDSELGGQPEGESAAANVPACAYPRLPPPMDGAPDLVFDHELFPQLFDLYAVYGWDGIRAAEQAIAAKGGPVEGGLPGGTPQPPVWQAAWGLFAFTRDLLGLLIRQELIRIEAQASPLTFDGLAYSKKVLNETWQELRVIRTETTVTEPVSDVRKTQVFYRFGDEKASMALHETLLKAAEERQKLESIVAKLAGIRREIADGPDEFEKLLAALSKEEQLRLLAERSGETFKQLQAVLFGNCPLGFLVWDMPVSKHSRPWMEQKLGAILYTLRDEVNQLKPAKAARRVEQGLPGYSVWDPESLRRQRLPAQGPEQRLLEAAEQGLSNDLGWLPLIHERTFQHLIASGDIPRDSFTYIVAHHYLLALTDRIEQSSAEEQASESFWKSLFKLGAILSLATLAGPLAWPLAAIAGLTNLALHVYSVASVIDQMTKMNRAIATKLTGPDVLSAHVLAELGELTVARAQLIDDAMTQMLLQFALARLTRVGGALNAASSLPRSLLVIKKGLLVYGYAQDLKVLLEPIDG